nr:MAG TPA: hypothetical protein [Caudoviricetes sp.]
MLSALGYGTLRKSKPGGQPAPENPAAPHEPNPAPTPHGGGFPHDKTMRTQNPQ